MFKAALKQGMRRRSLYAYNHPPAIRRPRRGRSRDAPALVEAGKLLGVDVLWIIW